jgi:hypothetical protein
VVIYVSSEQPFRSRLGVDTVLLLRFRYDAGLVDTLKRSLRAARSDAVSNCGGWLKDYGAWFCEKSCWSRVRRALERAGHAVVVAAACQ